MRRIVLASETDWEGWRKATRALVLAGAAPEDVRWSVRSHDEEGDPLPEATGSFGISRALVSLASLAIQARDPERFDLLYRLVWRANAGERVLAKTDDPEVRRAQGLAFAVRAEAHRMRTLLRYLPVTEGDRTRYLGWYEPAHYVLEANAQLIARRFPDLAFSILTPDGAAHWDGTELRFSTGVDARAVPDDAALQSWWRTHHAGLLRHASRWHRRSRRRNSSTKRRGRPIARRSVRSCCRCIPMHRCRRRCTKPPTAAAAIFTNQQPRRCSAKVRRTPSVAVRRRAAGRPGGRDRPSVCRAGRPDHGSRDGGGRHRPAHRLHHQCGEALQVRTARQAAHPQDARGPRDPGLPLLARCRAGAVCARSWWWRWAAPRRGPCLAARSPSPANAAGRSRCPTGRRRSSPSTRLSCCGCPTKTRRRGSTAPSSPICGRWRSWCG